MGFAVKAHLETRNRLPEKFGNPLIQASQVLISNKEVCLCRKICFDEKR